MQIIHLLIYSVYIYALYLQKSLEHQIREKEDLSRQLRIKEGMVQEEQKKLQMRETELSKILAEKELQISTLKSFIVKFENHFTTVHLNLFAARDSTRSSSATEALAVRHQLILMNLLHDFFEGQSKKSKILCSLQPRLEYLLH